MELKNVNRTNVITFGLGAVAAATALLGIKSAIKFASIVRSDSAEKPSDSSLHYQIMSVLQQKFGADALANVIRPDNVDIYEIGYSSSDERLKGMKVYEVIVYKAFTYGQQLDEAESPWPTIYRSLMTGQGQEIISSIEETVGGNIYQSIVEIGTGFRYE